MVSTVCAAIPSAEGSKAPVWAEELSAPMESNDPQVSDGPQPVIALDPGIEDDDCILFWDDGCLSGTLSWSFEHLTP